MQIFHTSTKVPMKSSLRNEERLAKVNFFLSQLLLDEEGIDKIFQIIRVGELLGVCRLFCHPRARYILKYILVLGARS